MKRIIAILLSMILLLSMDELNAEAANVQYVVGAVLQDSTGAASDAWNAYAGATTEFGQAIDAIEPTTSGDTEGNTVVTFPECPQLSDDWKLVGYQYQVQVKKTSGKGNDVVDQNGNLASDPSTFYNTDSRTLTLSLPGRTLKAVSFNYVIAPNDVKEEAQISYENVFAGSSTDHGYSDWNSVKNTADQILSGKDYKTATYTGEAWTVPVPDDIDTSSMNDAWVITSIKVSYDGGTTWTELPSNNREITPAAGTQSIKVQYGWQLISVSNVIQPLDKDRVVTQGGTTLTKQTVSGTDLYIADGKDNIKVGYIPAMDMSGLDSYRYGAMSWQTLKDKYAQMTNDTVVTLTFEFDSHLSISESDFANIELVNDMFTLDQNGITVSGNKVTMTCHWDSDKAAKSVTDHDELNSMIKIATPVHNEDGTTSYKPVYFSVKDDWTGETLLLSNEGSVSGRGYYTSGNNTIDFGIYGGYQRDTVAFGVGTENDPPVKKSVTGDKTDKKAAFTFAIEPASDSYPLPMKDGKTVSEVMINWPEE